ncbi:MAG: lytic transglycosylase domain-containing protein [Kordiimonadaceae bacterium]|nr:lytic transglycosylase domain-containing protein [Kordiimonadaceae bacterium]
MNSLKSSIIFCLTALLVSSIAFSSSPAVVAQENENVIPSELSSKDIKRYRRIFELQEQSRWKKADKLIKQLDNSILMGHVKFQRYMHRTGYRSRYSELAGWLKSYNDHPSAWRVYRLARKRQGRARAPRKPATTRYPGVTGQAAKAKPALPKRSKLERRAIKKFFANVRRYVRRGTPERAEKRYWAMDHRNLLIAHEKAGALERIAASYYYKGNDFKARLLATMATDFAREFEPSADWVAGLANWRMGNTEQALEHFDTLGDAPRASEWLQSAGYFWTSRAAFRLGKTAKGLENLSAASGYSETFYGLIAARQLGIKSDIDWSVPSLDQGGMNNLLRHITVRRAIALTEISLNDIADEELRLLWARKGTAIQEDLLGLAVALNLPAIQTRLGRAHGTEHPAPTAVRYPLPDWKPAGGFKIDRALVFAMVRKESDFRSRAKSRVGAGGLMQVMPATARYISKKGSLLRKNRHRLYEPEFNMALGQRYINYLLDLDLVEGNLLMALAAYNGGPGSLAIWHKEVDFQNDPFLFIESIGFYETRDYIERVMAGLWLYRMRIGQESPSLDALASGAWPTLEYLDTKQTVAAIRRAVTKTVTRTTAVAED